MGFIKTLITLFLMALPAYFNISAIYSNDLTFIISCYIGSIIMSGGLALAYRSFTRFASYKSSLMFSIINDLFVATIIGYFIYDIVIGKLDTFNVHYLQILTISIAVISAVFVHIFTSYKKEAKEKPVVR